jgi:hypothetical protein
VLNATFEISAWLKVAINPKPLVSDLTDAG